MEVKVGDRVRSTRVYPSGTRQIWEYTVTLADRDSWESKVVAFYADDDLWTHELIERPAPSEPTGLMAVVEVDDRLFTRLDDGCWVDRDSRLWSWKGVTKQYNPSPKITVLYEGKDPHDN